MATDRSKPDRAFFEADPRSALLRNVCLQAIEASRAMIEEDDETALPFILDANRRLAQMGVEPNMHTIPSDAPDMKARQELIRTTPILAAEWLSGQVREFMIRTAGSMATASAHRDQLEEHDELLGEGRGAYLMRAGVMPDRVLGITMLGMLSSMLDYDAGPSEL